MFLGGGARSLPPKHLNRDGWEDCMKTEEQLGMMKYICVYLFQPNACKDDVWNQLRNLVDDDKLELCEDMGSFYCNSA